MFWWIPMAIGAAAGAMSNKRDPLKGAAIGAGMGYLGGAAAPMLGAGGAAAGSGAAAGGGAASAGGLLGSGTSVAGIGTGTAVPGLTAGGAGMGGAMPYGITAMGTPAQVAEQSTGLLGSMKTAGTYLKPIGDAAGSAGNIYGLYNMATRRRPEPQVQSSPVMQGGNGPMGLQSLVAQNQQADQMRQQAEMERRARRMAMFSGGGYGRFA